MIFLGSFLGADELSLSPTPTAVNNITSITITDTLLDTLYVSKDIESEITEEIPSGWNFDTIIYTPYDTTTVATNVEWALETVSYLLVKRKRKEDFTWTTLKAVEIHDLHDFAIEGRDITPTTGDYIYAVVPVLNGVEGAYNQAEVRVDVTKLCLMDSTATWSTFFTDGNANITWTTPGNFVTTLKDRYPTYVSNTIANYQTISITGEFYPTEDGCDMDLMMDDEERIKYIYEFSLFLTNRRPKILKNVDGHRWLVMVNDGVTDNMKDFYKEREITFTCTEIGDSDSTEDLAACGITDVPIEYW